MKKNKVLDFNRRNEEEQELLLSETWCHKCNEADLGMMEPIEFEVKGIVYLEGKCTVCGYTIVKEIVEENV